MFLARSHADLHNIRLGVEKVRKVSDRLIGIGPIGIGLDGVLSFLPIVGVLYSAATGAMLVLDAIRARAAPSVVFRIGMLMTLNTLLDVPGGTPLGPFSGIADTLFTAHKWSANLLTKHMDNTVYLEGSPQQARANPQYTELLARSRAGQEKRRIVFLG